MATSSSTTKKKVKSEMEFRRRHFGTTAPTYITSTASSMSLLGGWCAAAAAAAAWPLLSMDAVVYWMNHWGEDKVAEYMPALSLRPLSIDTFLPRERSRVRARLPFGTLLLSHSALVLSCIDDYCLLGKRVKTAAAAAMTTKWGMHHRI